MADDVVGIKTTDAGSTWSHTDALYIPFQEYGSNSQGMVITDDMNWQ